MTYNPYSCLHSPLELNRSLKNNLILFAVETALRHGLCVCVVLSKLFTYTES